MDHGSTPDKRERILPAQIFETKCDVISCGIRGTTADISRLGNNGLDVKVIHHRDLVSRFTLPRDVHLDFPSRYCGKVIN
jgi:hypothetical protein